MKQQIKNGDQLFEWFLAVIRSPGDKWSEGICVTTAVRREVLISDRQGRIVLKGSVRTISFENLGGGVYRAYISAASAAKGG